MRTRVPLASRRHRFALLLALLLVSLAIQSFDARPGAGGLLSDASRTVLGVVLFVVVFEHKRERAAMAIILALIVTIGWGRRLLAASLDHTVSLGADVLTALYLWFAVWVILRELFRQTAGAENVLGAICGYLIAGDAWTRVNMIAYLLAPATYTFSPDVSALLADWHGRLALFSHYSFAQMLTIGYADVTPVRAPATTLSLLGALFGLFYTAVVVSQFVGLAQSRGREMPGDR